MQMDSLYWNNLKHGIKECVTKKAYFGRFLWRLEYEIKKVNLITEIRAPDIGKYVQNQYDYEMNRIHNGTPSYYSTVSYNYRPGRPEDWENIDVYLLEHIRHVREKCKDQVKFRVEGDRLQLFAETEAELQHFCSIISCYDLVSITGPKAGTEDALLNGTVFMNKTKYKYKIMLRDGDYGIDTKKKILTQLKENSEVSLPNHTMLMLGKKYTYLWGSYFYTNDESVITIISLIAPGIVGKIHTVEHLQ